MNVELAWLRRPMVLSSVRSFADDRLTLLFISLAILVAGGNFVVTACLYILGGYVGRAYQEAKGRPAYVVLQVLGEESGDGEGSGTAGTTPRSI